MNKDERIEALLRKKEDEGTLRTLNHINGALVDFSSNDYLGLARSSALKTQIVASYNQTSHPNGSTGSRLLTGNNKNIETCEGDLASFFGFEATTLFNSGYMANLAFFSTLPQKGDTILYDEYIHACIKDGCRLSLAKKFSFKHNNLIDLERKLQAAEGNIYVACESVYSMDGDMAPLKELTELVNRYHGRLVVDEAHSTGIWGKGGAGLVSELGLTDEVYAVIYTFGKAMGIHGACLTGSKTLKSFIVNYSRPFIYTTAPSPFEVISIQEGFRFLQKHPELSLNLFDKIRLFNELLPKFSSLTAIKSIIIGGNDKTRQVALNLQKSGFDVRPILSPTVQEGTERLRICLHTFNTEKEIALICDQLRQETD